MSGPNGENGAIRQEPDLAQAFKELARGEQTADALEKNLNSLEQKIEDMLKKAEEDERTLKLKTEQAKDSSPSTESKTGS